MRNPRWAIFLVFLAASCVAPPKPLPPPGPPTPAPPPAVAPKAEVAHQDAQGRPGVRPPTFVVAILRIENGRRSVDGARAVTLVNLLARNGLMARKAQDLSPDLPESLMEAAKTAAAAADRAGGPGQVFILGDVRPGKDVEVRLAAVDLRTGKVIDNFGNKGPQGHEEEILRKTADELLRSVEAYWAQNP